MALNGYPVAMLRGPYAADFKTAIGLGLVAGMSRVAVIGRAANLTTSTTYDLYENASSVPLYPYLSSASQLQISSASANDTAAGTGVRSVLIAGLNSAFNPISETVVTNGTTPVVTVNSYLRVNTFIANGAGSGSQTANAGDITLQKSGGGNILAIMRAGSGFANTCVYTVPAGNSLFIDSGSWSMEGSPAANSGDVGICNNGTGVYVTGLRFAISSGFPFEQAIALGLVLPQQTDVSVRVIGVAQASTNVSGGVEAFLINNSYFA